MMACSHAPVAAWGHARLGLPVGTRTRAPPRRGIRCSAVATDASSTGGTRQWLRLECTRGDDMTDTVELQSAVTRLVGTPADLRRYGGMEVAQDVEVRRCCDVAGAFLNCHDLGSSLPRVHSLRRAAGFDVPMVELDPRGKVGGCRWSTPLEGQLSCCRCQAARPPRPNTPANSPVLASVRDKH